MNSNASARGIAACWQFVKLLVPLSVQPVSSKTLHDTGLEPTARFRPEMSAFVGFKSQAEAGGLSKRVSHSGPYHLSPSVGMEGVRHCP